VGGYFIDEPFGVVWVAHVIEGLGVLLWKEPIVIGLVLPQQVDVEGTLCAEITNDGKSDTSHINPNSVVTANHSIFTGYLSDLSSESDSEADNSEDESEDTSSGAETLHQCCQF